MPPRLFNSLGRAMEDFAPMAPPRVGLYTCGPTVYGDQHVGNYRTYVFEDVLKRALRFFGFEVFHVMNITDVGHLTSQADDGEDKIEAGARREGKSARELSRFYEAAFLRDCAELKIVPPDVLCRATEHIPEQIALIQRLEAKGFLYKTSDGIYFDSARFPGYGRLVGAKHLAGMEFGARVKANPDKKSPSDFAVWKFSPRDSKRQMEWDSPWGRGFPGWHIECSAMAMKYLGDAFDIHCGGVDHIPIHHANEIAQSEAATGKPPARFWLHGEFLLMNESKMAKSRGGFVTVAELKKRGFDPLDFRYHCLTAHYRRQLDFSWEVLEAARTARRRLKEFFSGFRSRPEKPACADSASAFQKALEDDLNVPEALSVVWSDAKNPGLPEGSRATFLRMAEGVLGLGLADEERAELPMEAAHILRLREDARKKRDFALSDRLRRELGEKGIIVEDSPAGQKWRRA